MYSVLLYEFRNKLKDTIKPNFFLLQIGTHIVLERISSKNENSLTISLLFEMTKHSVVPDQSLIKLLKCKIAIN